jgi:predicted DNA-binding transcriptional regulator YafY
MLKATERLERLISMVPWLLANNGAAIEELSERFQYPRETLINDLTKVLFFVGPHPHTPDNLIEVNVQEEEVWINQANYLSRPLNLTHTEAFSLLAKGKMLLGLIDEDTGNSSLETALEKLSSALGAEQNQIIVDPGIRDSEAYAITNESLSSRKKMVIKYYSFNEDYYSERKIQPLSVGINDRYLYLRAYCEKVKDYRTFRMDRIIHAESINEDIEQKFLDRLEDERFENPVDFEFQFPTDSIVTLLIKKSDSWIISKYSTVSVNERGDNMLEITLPVASNTWLGRLLLQLEPETTVINASPNINIDAGRELAKQILDRYGSND